MSDSSKVTTILDGAFDKPWEKYLKEECKKQDSKSRILIACFCGFAKIFNNMVVAYAEVFSWIFLLLVFFARYLLRRTRSCVSHNNCL